MIVQLRYTKMYERNLQIDVFLVVHLSVVKHLFCSIFPCTEFSTHTELADPFIIASTDVLIWKLIEAITGFGVGLYRMDYKISHHV